MEKIAGFYDEKEGKEKILDDDIYKYCKDKNVASIEALLMQIVRLLRK